MGTEHRNKFQTSVATGIVKKLKDKPGGINPIIDELRKDYLLDVSYDGELKLQGPYEDILDIALEFLESKLGLAPSLPKKSLGVGGTVVWTYRGKPAKHFKHLFVDEQNELETKSLKIEKPNADLVISCIYSNYEEVNGMLLDIDKKIANCKEKSVKVDAKDQQRAKKFEKETIRNNFYCCLNVGKTEQNKAELQFYGREAKDCQEGISQWEETKQGGKKQPTLTSTNTFNDGGSHETSSAQNFAKPKPHLESLPSKHVPSTMESDWGETKPVSVNNLSPKMMSQTKDEVSYVKMSASGSALKDSISLSNSQRKETSTFVTQKSTNNSKPSNASFTDSASERLRADVRPRVAITEVRKTLGRTTGSGDTAKYSFQIEDIHFFVYKESITEIKGMDAITNAANEKLMHGGGVAYYISKAAGKRMDQDCHNFIAKNGPLQVAQNFVSISGDIKCKGIIHAVGPTWYDYNDKREDCARALYTTIKNVLAAATKEKWQKIALSAISSGLFGVPKKLCAEMYIKAFADFATEVDRTVKEVHFIDLNREILDLVIDAHKIWLKDESKLDFKNALQYASAVSKRQTRKGSGLEEQDCLIQSIGTDKTAYGETRYKYSVCKKLAVFVYKGSLTRLETVDAIALTIDPDPKYRRALEHSVRTFAGPKYASEVDKFRNGKNGRVFVLDGSGSLRCKYVVHIIPSPAKGVGKDIFSVLSEVYRLALTLNCKSEIRSLAMPLFGAGGAGLKAGVQALCKIVIHTLVSMCYDSGTPMNVEELHLVNLDSTVSICLREEFSEFSKGMKVSKGTKEAYKYDPQTTVFSSYNPSTYTEHHQWIKHTTLKDSKSAKPENESKDKTKEKQGKVSTIEEAPSDGKCIYCDKKAKLKVKECNHMYCSTCAVSIKESGICLKCYKGSKKTAMNSKNADEACPICLEPPKHAEVLPCSHTLCRTCYEEVKKQKPQCPICQHIFGDVKGTQPYGDMLYRHVSQRSLPGYDGCGTIEIYYIIPSGKQDKYHPHPGRPYRGIERRAYLPDNQEGKEILHLLRRAFDKKLVFTIGESRTTGEEGVVTWNDIHHKTKPYGGPERFGYPDPTYLARVREELAAKGVMQ